MKNGEKEKSDAKKQDGKDGIKSDQKLAPKKESKKVYVLFVPSFNFSAITDEL